MVFIYPSGNSDHKQDHSYKRKRRNRFWVYAIENRMVLHLYWFLLEEDVRISAVVL